MGAAVRYDGRAKAAPILTLLTPHVRWLPICPESMAGLGIPRPPVQLVGAEDNLKALGRDLHQLDVSAQLRSMAQIIARSYPALNGFIGQTRSPSCGVGSTPRFTLNNRQPTGASGHGLFVSELDSHFADLPCLDSQHLIRETREAREILQTFLQKAREHRQRQLA